MIQYARPTVDNLINNLPDLLKSSRQFLAWDLQAGAKKVPLKADGSSWGSYADPNCWRTFEHAIDLLDRCKAFGIGLALPSFEQVIALPEFKLIPGLVAFDGDAKRSSIATQYSVPDHISAYIRSAQSYCEFSTSLKGLRALAFGYLPTHKQNLTRTFGDGTELSLYRGGWVTLSGLPYGDSSHTIEHRQQVIDQIVAELWPDLIAGVGAAEQAIAVTAPIREGENFILDWSHPASEDRVRRFIQGINRAPKQLRDIEATWELKRGWNHGSSPDNSFCTKRILEEGLWLRRYFGWTLQDAVDIVITFCKKNQLRWSFGRAKKQIEDGQRYIAVTRQRRNGGGDDFAPPSSPQLDATDHAAVHCFSSFRHPMKTAN